MHPDLSARAAALREQARPLPAEAARLEDAARPSHVLVDVAHWRFGVYHVDEGYAANVADAVETLEVYLEQDDVSANGVVVAGAFISFNTARDVAHGRETP
jgi:hypothetical protein